MTVEDLKANLDVIPLSEFYGKIIYYYFNA